MAVITAALGAIEVIGQIKDIVGSQDPLLVRFRNETEKTVFQFSYLRELNNIENRSLPSPYIGPGSTADAAFGAGSWDSASLLVNYLAHKGGQTYEVALKYIWVTKFQAQINLKLTKHGATPVEHTGSIFETLHASWEEFDVFVLSSGSLVEIVVEDKGVF